MIEGAPQAAAQDKWLTVETIAQRWGIKPSAILKAIADDKLIAARIGQATIVESADLDAWFKSEKKPASAKEA